MTRDVLVALGLSPVLTAGAFLVHVGLTRKVLVPPSPEQRQRRPVIERWFFGLTLVLMFFAVLLGLRG